MEYEITIDDGGGYARCIRRKREDAAMRSLEHAVNEACDAQGLRETAIARRAMKKAHAWTTRHPIEPIRIGAYTITISAEELP